jgi:hypothetical protein
MLDLIDEKLPSCMRKDYLKLKSNSFLLKKRKSDIISAIRDILQSQDGDESEGEEDEER